MTEDRKPVKTAAPGGGRNAGLDLLRMVSMLMVVVLHVLGQGGVMVRTGSNDPTYFTVYFLETVCLCAVNCYGLLSGYVGIRSRFNVRKLIAMILTVEVYSLLIGLLLGLPNRDWLDRDTWLKIILPIQWKTWWYYSAYVGLYLIMPFLNRGVKALSRKEKENLLSVSFVVFCVLTMFAKTFSVDFFSLVGGYSLIWLVILYVFGAALRELDPEGRPAGQAGTVGAGYRPAEQADAAGEGYQPAEQAGAAGAGYRPAGQADAADMGNGTEIPAGEGPAAESPGDDAGRPGLWGRILRLRLPALLGIFLCSTTLAWLWKVLVDTHVITAPADTQLQRMLLIYHSPTIMINGLALLLLFRRLRITSAGFRGAISLLAPSAFYVYIIHTHPLIWEHVLKTAFAPWRNLPAALVLLPVLGTALGIYLLCTGIDTGRRQLARLAGLAGSGRPRRAKEDSTRGV